MKPYESICAAYKEKQHYELPLYAQVSRYHFRSPTYKFPLSPFRTIKAMKLDVAKVGYANYMKYRKISELTQI